MSNREFTATRTMLANAMATAGAELLEYMGTSAALAAIPHSEPPRYVVAGTLAEIVKLLPGAEAIRAITAQGGNASLEGLTHDGWLVDGGLIYRLNDEGFNCDEINVTMVNGNRDRARCHDAAVELLATLRESDAAPVPPLTTPAPQTDNEQAIWLWDSAKAEAAMYVEAHCVDGETHARHIMNQTRPKLTAAPAPQQSESINTTEFQALAGTWCGASQSCDQWTRTEGARRAWADLVAHIDSHRAKAAPAAHVPSVTEYQVICASGDAILAGMKPGEVSYDFALVRNLGIKIDGQDVAPAAPVQTAEQGKFAERLYGPAPSVDERRDALHTLALIFAAAESDSAREACFEDMYREFLAVPRMSIFDSLTRHTGAEISTNHTFELDEFYEVDAVARVLAELSLTAPVQTSLEFTAELDRLLGRWASAAEDGSTSHEAIREKIISFIRVAAPVQAEQAQAEPVATLLAALDEHLSENDYGGLEVGKQYAPDMMRAIEAARTAIQAKATPVAWMNPNEGCVMDAFLWQKDAANPKYSQPVYGAPVAALPAQAEQAEAVRAAEWIELGDEWPKNHQDVWVTHKTEYTNAPASYSVMEAVYVNGMWSDARSDNRISTPTHWMPRNRPLPAAPSTATSNDTAALGDTGGEK